MPTPLKRHYNTNFTDFEASGLAYRVADVAVLKYAQREVLKLNTICARKKNKDVAYAINWKSVSTSRFL